MNEKSGHHHSHHYVCIYIYIQFKWQITHTHKQIPNDFKCHILYKLNVYVCDFCVFENENEQKKKSNDHHSCINNKKRLENVET